VSVVELSLACFAQYERVQYVPEEANELLKEIRIKRMERAVGYACITVAGVFLTIAPSEIVGANVSHWVELLWSISMIVSGACCFYGSFTDKWIGEYAGAPLLLSVVFLYSGAAIKSSWGESLTIFAFGLFFAAYGWSLWGRWKDVRAIRNQAIALGCSEKE
jgi:hypothetical protein